MNKSVHQDYFNLNQINLELLTQKKKYKELFENLSKEYIKKEENNKFLASQLRKIVKNSDESDNLNDFPAFFLNEIKLIEGIPLHYPNEELILRECFDVMEETSSLLKNFSLTLAIRLEKTLKKIKIFFEKQKSDLVGIYSILDILKINALKKSISEKILKNPNILEEIKVSIDNYQKSEHREILNEMENNNLNFQLKIFEKDNQLLKLQIKELKEKNDKLNEQCMDLIAKNKNFSKEKSILRDQNEDFSQKASEYWKRFQEIHNLIQVLGCNFKLIQNNNFENPITETNIYKELFLNEKLKVYDLQKQSEENARNVSDLNTFSFNFESKFTNLVVGDGEDKQYHNIKSELQLKSCSEKNFKQNSVQDTLEEERKEGILRYELPSHYAFIQKEIVESNLKIKIFN